MAEFTAVTVLLLLAAEGCKDGKGTHLAAKTSKCKNYLDNSNWDKAIKTCQDLKTDDGYHKAAQAHMGRSGVDLFSLALELSEDSADATKLIYDKIPDTADKRSDYSKALALIMESVEKRTDVMYLEAVLVSGMLVFGELKKLLGLKLSQDTFTTCAGATGSEDVTKCSFAPMADNTNLNFGGLGADFYSTTCGDSDSTTDTSSGDPPGVTRNVKVDGCTIQTDSMLHYNKIASEEYAKIGAKKVVDAVKALNFHSKMDTGGNFHRDIGPLGNVYFCQDTGHMSLQPEKPVAGDGKLNDCEMLSYFENPNF